MPIGGHGKKLTSEQVEQIRYLYRTQKITVRELGEMYGVSRQTISNVVSFKFYNTKEAQIGSTR